MRQIQVPQELTQGQVDALTAQIPGASVHNFGNGAIIMYPEPEYRKVQKLLKEFNLYLTTVNERQMVMMENSNAVVNKLIDEIRSRGTDNFEQLVAIVTAFNQQGHIMREQLRILETMANKSGYHLAPHSVGNDFVGGNKVIVEGSIYNIGINGGAGSGLNFTGIQECQWFPVDYEY